MYLKFLLLQKHHQDKPLIDKLLAYDLVPVGEFLQLQFRQTQLPGDRSQIHLDCSIVEKLILKKHEVRVDWKFIADFFFREYKDFWKLIKTQNRESMRRR